MVRGNVTKGHIIKGKPDKNSHCYIYARSTMSGIKELG
jgi:hypothetical protein